MEKKTLAALLVLAASIVDGCGNNHRGAIEASGTLEAVDVNISAKVPGQLQQMFVHEGSQVNAGDTLAILDHSTLELQLRQAQAGVELADAQHQLLVNGA